MKRTNLLLPLLSIVLLFPVVTQAATTDDDEPMASGVILKKSVSEPDANDNYTITLGAYTTGQRITKIEQTRKPADIVLLLDDSGSMDDTYYTYSYTAQTSKSYSASELGREALQNGEIKTNYYYKHSDGQLYQVIVYNARNTSIFQWVPELYAYYVVNGVKYYLSGTTVSTTKPSGVEDNDTTIWTGELYRLTRNNQGSRLSNLKTAVNAFIDVVNQDAIANNVEHRISIIAFADNSYPYNNYTTNGNKDYLRESTSSGDTRVLKNFVNASSNTNVTTLKNAVNSMGGSGDTSSDYAMNLANLEFSAYGRTNVAQTVVMFTDGVPNHGGTPMQDQVANDAIAYAKTLKDGGAKVFTVGIIDVNDLSNADKTKVPLYMNAVSSNYPSATSMSSMGTGNDNFGYYKDASTGGLTDVFEGIASEAVEGGADIDLNETSIVVVDVMSNYFQLPEGADASSITTYAVPCNGYDENSKEYLFDEATHESVNVTIAVNSQTKEVDVMGFDFAQNFCGKDISISSEGESDYVYTGRKLVIEIPIIVDPANPGGANLVTNDATKSGIYTGKMENGQLVKDEKVSTFPKPMVILPNIVLVKQGLQRKGESATFRIERVANKNGDAFDGDFTPFTISLTQKKDYTNGGEPTELMAKVKLLDEGWYRITESSWSKGYKASVNAGKTLQRRAATYSEANRVYEQDTEIKVDTTADGCPYLIRYVGESTEWETAKQVDGKTFYSVGTPFYFLNELKGKDEGRDPSKYSEANVLNKFE